MNLNYHICYVLDALLRTEWRARGTSASLRFYPAVDANGPRCLLTSPPPHGAPDPIRNMVVNTSSGAILYECNSRTYAHRQREAVSDGNILGVLALVVDHPWESDPVEDWGIVTENRIISVTVPGDRILQMIPANLFCRRFGSDQDTGPDCYPPVPRPTAVTRQFPVVIDGRDGPRRIMRGHLDMALPEEATNMARDPARLAERAGLPASAISPAISSAISSAIAPAIAPETPPRSAISPAISSAISPAIAPAVAPETPPNVPVDAARTASLTDQLAGMYSYYVLGALLGTRWETTPETRDDGTKWSPIIDVYFEPRIRDDGTMAYPVDRRTVSMWEPGISVHVFIDHVEISGPDFETATSYWDLPESEYDPVGALVLWNRNWRENPNATSPLYLAYPIYCIGELEVDGETVPMVPAEDLESCFQTWDVRPWELSFGNLRPVGDSDPQAYPHNLKRLAGLEILVRAPLCLDDPHGQDTLTHRVALAGRDFDGLLRDTLRENLVLMTMGRHPLAPEQEPNPAPEAPGNPETVEAHPATVTEEPGTQEPDRASPTADVSLWHLVNVLTENLQVVLGTLNVLKQTLPKED